jgi:ferredoxin-NADP reductase
VLPHLRDDQDIFVCGSAPFTNAVGDLLLELGVVAERARFERFGPSA